VDDLVSRPTRGRVFSLTSVVRFGDTDRSGRLRLDALARVLQDAGNDDFLDAGLDPMSPWLARRSIVVTQQWPRLGETLDIATWCGGLGSRWAERRSSLRGRDGGAVDVATLWVHVDMGGRPTKLPQWFLDVYGDAAGDRTVGTKLRLPAPTETAASRAWPLRSVDLDVMDHVNNAAVWAPVEDECARRGVTPAVAMVEFAGALLADDEVILRSDGGSLWLTVGGDVRIAAEVTG
jgi:acyl-ACP thioesterase